MDGFLLIDKEKGMTSFDVIRVLKRKFGVKKLKIGHAGTLDPIATGLMIIAIGKATKLLGRFLGADKTYIGSAKFGAVSDTYDADGQITEMSGIEPVSLDMIKKVVQENFTGKINQMPPKFSAKKVNGKRAYDLARKGEDFVLKPKEVEIYDFRILSFEWPRAEFSVSCSSGTYIRSLVHDLGQALGVGAYMDSLRRIQIGRAKIEDAVKISEFEVESNGLIGLESSSLWNS
jgi:tRNA pseudouridine55 synthase